MGNLDLQERNKQLNISWSQNIEKLLILNFMS